MGMALGVLIERSSAPPPVAPSALASRTFTAPRGYAPEVQPRAPALDDRDFDFDLDLDPDFVRPPGRYAPGLGLRIQPFVPRPHGPPTAAPSVDDFARALGRELCDTLADCAAADPTVALACRAVVGQLDSAELADRVARGECYYDAAAAARCVDGLSALDCTAASPDPRAAMLAFRVVTSCLDAVRCDGW